MNYTSTFALGDIVFLKTCPEQLERMVTGITFRPNGAVYMISIGSNESNHYEIEISSEKNLLKELNISIGDNQV